MCFSICAVFKLLKYNAVFNLCIKCLSLSDRTFHSLGSRGKYHLCSECGNESSSFDAHRIGHCKYYIVSFDSSYKRKAYACISAGGFDYCRSGFQNSLLLGIFDHSQCDSVFNGTCGVKVFDFEIHFRIRIVFFKESVRF